MVELVDGLVFVSVGVLCNEVFCFGKDGGCFVQFLFMILIVIFDIVLDVVGNFWVMIGLQLLMIDVGSGVVIYMVVVLGSDLLIYVFVIQLGSGLIYVVSGNGVEIYDFKVDVGCGWIYFSNICVGDFVFGLDGCLWVVCWIGSDVVSVLFEVMIDIISFLMSGVIKGCVEFEYCFSGLVDSIIFGQVGMGLVGLLLVSSNMVQYLVVVDGSILVVYISVVWVIELKGCCVFKFVQGGMCGESIVVIVDGCIFVVEINCIDEFVLVKVFKVVLVSVVDGVLVLLLLMIFVVSFDQLMWIGVDGDDISGLILVLNFVNYSFIVVGVNSDLMLLLESVCWDVVSKSVILILFNLLVGVWCFEVLGWVCSVQQVELGVFWDLIFIVVMDIFNFVCIDFVDMCVDCLMGVISYDVSIINFGVDDFKGLLMLLFDLGCYFGDVIVGVMQGDGVQVEFWVLDLIVVF